MIKLIALDRDGIINEDNPNYVKSLAEWHTVPGCVEAIAKLKKQGFKIIIVTNQSGVGRGIITMDTVNLLHQHMLSEIRSAGGDIEKIFICPHKPDDNCECRKPKPGLLLQATKKFNVRPEEIVMIGDSIRDVLTAKNCGAHAIFIKTTDRKNSDLQAAKKDRVLIYDSLAEAVDYLCDK